MYNQYIQNTRRYPNIYPNIPKIYKNVPNVQNTKRRGRPAAAWYFVYLNMSLYIFDIFGYMFECIFNTCSMYVWYLSNIMLVYFLYFFDTLGNF